jgi:dienelactone hydrolase
MSTNDPRADVARRPLVLQLSGMNDVVVERNTPYRDGEDGVFDVYRAADASPAAARPGVIFVVGNPDAGARRFVGCALRDMESYVTWARLLAVSGFVAMTYTSAEPATDAVRVLEHVRANAASLGVDPRRIGIWSCSGNAPNALALLMSHGDAVRCALLYYPYTLDLDGSTAVAEAAAMYRFTNTPAGRALQDLPPLPLCLVRAGQDTMHRLNEALDRFADRLIKADRPLTCINAAGAPHAFDIMTDTDASRGVIRQSLEFLRVHLLEPS